MNTTNAPLGMVVRRRLGFRCAHCRRVAQAQAEWQGGNPATIECSHCGEAFVLPAGLDRGSSDSHYRERIRAFGLANGLDSATATSVLEQIVSLDEARALRPSAQPPAPVFAAKPRSNKLLVAGLVGIVCCTTLLAMRRMPGRELPMEVSVVSVAEPSPAPAPEAAPPLPPPAPPPPVVTWTSAEGDLTEISGPDPTTVLESFCRRSGEMEAVAVTAAVPPNPGVRLGVVRRAGDARADRAITIRRDPRTGQWFAGDRRTPVRPQPLPPGAPTFDTTTPEETPLTKEGAES